MRLRIAFGSSVAKIMMVQVNLTERELEVWKALPARTGFISLRVESEIRTCQAQ